MIGFLHPWVLAGLAAAGVPVLLHLLARREPPTVVFPAVRYLVDTTREHQRRLKLQNLLLLLLRTGMVASLVLAAAGPTAPLRGVPGHAPSALVVVLDNSASSGAIVGGTPLLARLKSAARAALDRATPSDALWLVTADGVPRRGDGAELATLIGSLGVSPRRLDLGAALGAAVEVLSTDRRPGQVLLLSDLQASALSPASVPVPLVVARPDAPAVRNVGIASLDVGPQPWSTDGGRVNVVLAGDSGAAVPMTVTLGGRQRQALGATGAAVTVALPGVAAGWWQIDAAVEGDELRLDDRRTASVRVAPLARADCSAAGRFAAAACDVLRGNGRLASGSEITLGTLAPRGASIVLPPPDPAHVGALNRELARRGVGWSFGQPVEAAEQTDSGALVGRERVLRRYPLVSGGSGRTGVLATINGQPWLVRSGGVVLLGSRLEPEWTSLPLSARFMPFMDALLNRIARGDVALLSGAPGEPVLLPDLVTTVRAGDRSWQVEGGAAFRPAAVGTYYLTAAGDTVGALSVNVDPRESRLRRADDGTVRRLWRGARVVALDRGGDDAFASLARGDLRGALLLAALLLGLAEVVVASAWRRGGAAA